MTHCSLSRLLLVVGMSLAFPLSIPAQAPQLAQVGNPPVPTRPLVMRPVQVEATSRATITSAISQAPASPTVAIGQSGLSFRYVQAFGTTKQAYISDTAHLNYPYGLATDGNAIWIAEANGNRALKFSNTGQFLAQVGQAGINDYYQRTLRRLVDVGVDASGNIWLVDIDGAHVVKFDSAHNYVSEMGQQWNQGSDSSHFAFPTGIAFDATDNIYISDGTPDWNVDLGNQRIQIYNSSGVYLQTIGITGVSSSDNVHMHGPRHIAIYGNTLYVADSGNHRVQIFDVSNPLVPAYIATIGTGTAGSANNQLNNPSGVTADASYIYVADTWNNRVQIFNRSTRAYVTTVGGNWGSGNNQFKNPSDVAVDASGNLYVADYNNMRVQQFNAGRNLGLTYGVTGVPYLSDGAHLNQPRGVAIGSDGAIYTVEERGDRLIVLNSDGTPRWTAGTAGVGDTYSNSDMLHLNQPGDVAVDAAGRAYVADTWNHRIAIFNRDGTPDSTIGNWGIGPMQFSCPRGLTIAPNGAFYVADTCNHRVQIFSSNWIYSGTLGVPGTAGIDNAHFNSPEDVVVDSTGSIYVADTVNNRVQVFNSSQTYIRTLGVPGTSGSDFDHFNSPSRLAVDKQDNLYVADGWNHRIQVFDATGAYLTTIGGAGNGSNGQPHGTFGIAVDRDGSVYASGYWDDYRVHKFALGVPGWQQVNVNGFGSYGSMTALDSFNGQLYASKSGYPQPHIWRTTDGKNWQLAGTLPVSYTAIMDGIVFSNTLYLATAWGGPAQIWRSADGSAWSSVNSAGFGDPQMNAFGGFEVFSDTLYAIVSSWYPTRGLQIWRSMTGNIDDWTNVITNGFGNPNVSGITAGRIVFNGYLYGGFYDKVDGAPIWRTSNGTTWAQVNSPGFGDPANVEFTASAIFSNKLYFGGLNNTTGAQLWRSGNGLDWTPVLTNGFGLTQNIKIESLVPFDGSLYATVLNDETGMQIWRSADGDHWERVAEGGFGDSANADTLWANGTVVFGNHYYVSTWNKGGQIWKKTVTADYSADRTTIKPGVTVTFTNTSAGDVITSTWSFGDGGTLTGQLPQVVAHTYASPGTYTVTLTVNDGVDTNTIARTNYIQVGFRLYLPIVLGNSAQ